MPDLSLFSSPAPYHIITYGTLLGTEFFQHPNRTAVVLALTYPGSRNPLGPSSSLSGTLAESNRWSVLAPLATVFVGGLVNLVYVGPATTRIMRERKVQESKDGKKSYDPAPHSKEMQQLNRAFGKMHGVSSLVNLGALIATIWYGFSLAERIH
ncbi:hypothetical protein LARI1_G002902 [Lachnellula arida]|uniref:TMEM205-like domain-containing protein n=1 Tax=Lachnellula arida TaxID=1316785 RepID=A0A8T9BFG7_9HELO|nr:hypothetical protein LARI1_G002902 [Lachnellula arida]